MFLLEGDLFTELDNYLAPVAEEYANKWGALHGACFMSTINVTKRLNYKKHYLVKVIMFGIVKETQCKTQRENWYGLST